jgi:hypothetical protein
MIDGANLDNQDTQPGPAPMQAEQAADFAALQAQADAGDIAAPGAPGTGQEAPPAVPLADQLAGLLQMLTGLLKPVLPTVASIYSPEVCSAVGNAMAPVCNKHGWLQDGIGGKYAEEIMALAVIAPLGYATVQAAKSDIAANKAKEIPAPEKSAGASLFEAVPTPAPSQADPAGRSVQFGNVAPV